MYPWRLPFILSHLSLTILKFRWLQWCFKFSPHFFTPICDVTVSKKQLCRSAAIRSALSLSLLSLIVLKKPLAAVPLWDQPSFSTVIFYCIRPAACHYEISHHFFSLLLHDCIRATAVPLCRYKIGPQFFTLVFNCIREAACRYAAIRLAHIFSLLYLTVLQLPLAAMPLWD